MPLRKRLREDELRITFPAVSPHFTLAHRIRARILEEMTKKELNQTDVATFTKFSQSKVSKVLHGQRTMSIDDLESFCFAVSLSPAEVVRDHGLEFCAEMTPTELRFLERIRALPQADIDAVMQILDVKTKSRTPERRAAPIKKKLQSNR